MLLATLAAQTLINPGLATPPKDISDQPQTKEAGDLVVPNPKEESVTKETTLEQTRKAIASPESLVGQEFAPKASQASESPNAQPDWKTQQAVVPTVASPGSQATRTAIAPPETELILGRTSAQKDASKPVVQSAAPQVASSPETELPLARTSAQKDASKPVVQSTAPQLALSPETELPLARTSAQKDASKPVVQSAAPQLASATELAAVQSHSARDLQAPPTATQTATPQATISPQQTPAVVAENQSTTEQPCLEVDGLQTQLRDLENIKDKGKFEASPALSINIPTGFGADRNTAFISGTYQQRTRYADKSDGSIGVGVGLGDARKAVGVELSYTAASFGGSRDFGAGGFNVKVHRQLADDLSVAAGWNGILNVGGSNDFENSVYGSVTKIVRTQDDINKPFSRIALTAGVGNGQFRSENDVATDSGGINVFGNVAVRVAKPVSVIAEWSGQDLGVGVSIAPFKNIPLVITPAVRDLVGAGDGPRFVLGTGLAFRF